jgi:hypothetical protein
MKKNKNKEADLVVELVLNASEIENSYSFVRQAHEKILSYREEVVRLIVNYLSNIGDFTAYALYSPNNLSDKYTLNCYLPKQTTALVSTELLANKLGSQLFNSYDRITIGSLTFHAIVSNSTDNGIQLSLMVSSRGDLLDLCKMMGMPEEKRDSIFEWSRHIGEQEHILQMAKADLVENNNVVLLSEEEKNDDDEA